MFYIKTLDNFLRGRRSKNIRQKNFFDFDKKKFNDLKNFSDDNNFNSNKRGFPYNNWKNSNEKYGGKFYDEKFKSFNKKLKRRYFLMKLINK